MGFLANPLRLDLPGMTDNILAIPKTGFKPNPNTGKMWAPKGVVLHNTAAPSLGQWAGYSDAQKQNWGSNLNIYYKGMGWHSGPHFCGTPRVQNTAQCQAPTEAPACTNASPSHAP